MTHTLSRVSALALLAGLTASPSLAQDITVRALMEDVPETRIIEALLPEFTEETGIAVEFEKVGYGDMHDKLVAQLVGGQSYYNLLSVDFLWAGEFPEAGWLSDLTPYVDDSGFDMSGFIPSMLDLLGATDESLPIIPMYNYSMGMIYRTDLLEASGEALPDTLEGYVELAKAVSADGEVVGAAMQGQKGDPNAMEFSNYLYSAGGTYLDDAGQVALDSDAAVTALTLYADAIQNAAQTGALSATLDDTMRLMCSGEAFSMVTYWWMLPQLDNAESCPAVAGKLALSVMPGGAGESGGWGWGIPSNVAAAEGKHATSLDGVFSAPEVLEAHPYYAQGLKVVEAGKSFPIFTYTAQYEAVLGTQISLASSGDASPADAIAEAAEGLADLMSK